MKNNKICRPGGALAAEWKDSQAFAGFWWVKETHNKDDATVKVTMVSVQDGLWKIPVYENTKKLNVYDPILRFVPPTPLPEAKKPRA